MILRSLVVLAALAAQTAPAPAPQRDPRNWPEPVIDKVAPALPKLRPGAVLILSKTNGYRDPEQIDAAKPALVALIRKQGRDVFETENAAVMNRRDLKRFAAVIVNNTSGNIFDDSQRAAFKAWVEAGGGVVLLHGAGGDPKYDWAWWPEVLIGAQYIGHTRRPNQFQQATVEVLDRTHPATRKLPAKWVRTDEWYAFDHVPSGYGTQILATLDEASYDPAPATARMGRPHPIVWARCVGRGRVLFSGLGHKAETYSEPLHLELIAGAVRWASRREGKGCR